jgi:hypothetical protein
MTYRVYTDLIKNDFMKENTFKKSCHDFVKKMYFRHHIK